ncbi:hypothetical protein JHK82_019559 [Glycine max]|nr:hypothetical protein JHK85_020000 [Glycine max]KAG5038734.1 hypothetical protein JHK86_019574 [Glycine max]KAG5143864.1 hypothetical protein JHK82_019559 [Glycine max]
MIDLDKFCTPFLSQVFHSLGTQRKITLYLSPNFGVIQLEKVAYESQPRSEIFKSLALTDPLPYEAIFNFGNSISNTRNAVTYHPSRDANTPYGSTYFKHPSKFVAEAYGLSMLPAYLDLTKAQDIGYGVIEYKRRKGCRLHPLNKRLQRRKRKDKNKRGEMKLHVRNLRFPARD